MGGKGKNRESRKTLYLCEEDCSLKGWGGLNHEISKEEKKNEEERDMVLLN